ncbi:MAG: hydroxyethylthiazole kinase [Desulfovibrio sp.]|nr:hydroxyethylthiazole kinase [Desulfovibrio sp.]MCA1987115.1 hydroxyethylthiazole kinase [Desulfovibrio sp.]
MPVACSPAAVAADLDAIRTRGPFVVSITNYVVANTTANALLALGASPAMTHARKEVAEMTALCQALVVNMGTVTDAYLEAIPPAWESARDHHVPVVLDPVAAGATALRRNLARELLRRYIPAIIRGNASEILFCAGEQSTAKGPDSLQHTAEAEDAAIRLARDKGCTVCVSGEVDFLTDGTRALRLFNGHALMPRVTGLGCTATAVCAAFAAVQPDAFLAACHAMAVMGIAGEMAAEQSAGPGTLQLHLYDCLYAMQQADIAARLRQEPVV